MRDLCLIITQLLDHIPEERNYLRTELKNIQQNILYSAPEQLQYRWNEVGDILNRHIFTIEEDWQRQILNIFNKIN